MLTALVDLAAVDAAWSGAQVAAYVKTQRHSRMPVYEGSIDNIIGILPMRRFIKAYLQQGDALELRPLLDEAAELARYAMLDFLRRRTGWKVQELVMLLSLIGDTAVCQLVDPLATVRFTLRRPVFALEF